METMMVEPNSKLCRQCGRELPIEAFSYDRHQFDERSCYCRDCLSIRNKKYSKIKRSGRKVVLARATIEDLINELKYRLIWREEDVTLR